MNYKSIIFGVQASDIWDVDEIMKFYNSFIKKLENNKIKFGESV